jgi:hypothetical protein
MLDRTDAHYRAELDALTVDLREHGFQIETVNDWASGRTPPAAESALIFWLEQSIREDTREVVVRMLTQKDFRNAVPALLRQFARSDSDSTRWSISNAVAHIGFSRQHWPDILRLVANPRFGRGRQNLVSVLHRVRLPETEGVLLGLLDDRDVDAFAVTALSYCGSYATCQHLRGLSLEGRSPLFQREVPKAIRRLERKLPKRPN